MNFYSKKVNMKINKIEDIYTGVLRPRHIRFNAHAKKVASNLGLEFISEHPTIFDRIQTNIKTNVFGYRQYNKKITNNSIAIVHHALPNIASNYLLEIDLPLALNNYKIQNHRRSWKIVKDKLEAKDCKGVLVFSEWAKRNLILHYGSKVGNKAHVLYPLSSLEKNSTNSSIKNIDFIFISTQFLMKGGYQVLNAFKKLQKSGFYDAKLLIVTKLEEVRNISQEFKENKSIKWIEANLNESQVINLLKKTKCLLHPTLSDSFGVVVLEAMSQGCSIITTNIASFPELVSDENGFLINPPISTSTFDTYITEFGDAKYYNRYLETLNLDNFTEDIFQNMKALMSDQILSKHLMQGSIKKFSQKFSKNIWSDKFKEILNKIELTNV